eukprot:GDKJ01042873.1.p1 GENE.GDKJ01042873.1~~GDKJ01042873.1.p1  ORF type:complete len:1887 (-),score=527.99 GDKJ01042873.1:510-6170(-)
MLRVVSSFPPVKEFTSSATTFSEFSAELKSHFGYGVYAQADKVAISPSTFSAIRLKAEVSPEPLPVTVQKLSTVERNVAPLVFLLNNERIVVENPDPTLTLGKYIRRYTRFTGTKLSCQQAGCGACTVMISEIDPISQKVSHRSINSCTYPLCSVAGKAITTSEGIGSNEKGYHPIQTAMARGWATQCGYCTPGFVMAIYSVLAARAASGDENIPALPTKKEMEAALDGNICRCTGFRPIAQAAKKFTQDDANPTTSCGNKGVILDLEDLAGVTKSTTMMDKLRGDGVPCGVSSGEEAKEKGIICERTKEVCSGTCIHPEYVEPSICGNPNHKSIAAESDEKGDVLDKGERVAFLFTPPFDLPNLVEVNNETIEAGSDRVLSFVHHLTGRIWYSPMSVAQLKSVMSAHKNQRVRFVKAHTARAVFTINGDESLFSRPANSNVIDVDGSTSAESEKSSCCKGVKTASSSGGCCSSSSCDDDLSSTKLEALTSDRLPPNDWREQPDVYISLSYLASLQGVGLEFRIPKSEKCSRPQLTLSANGAATISDLIATVEAFLRHPNNSKNKCVPLLAVLARHMRLVATTQIRSVASWAGNIMLCREAGFPSDLGLVFSALGGRLAVIPYSTLSDEDESVLKGYSISVRDFIAGKGADGLITRLEVILDDASASADAPLIAAGVASMMGAENDVSSDTKIKAAALCGILEVLGVPVPHEVNAQLQTATLVNQFKNSKIAEIVDDDFVVLEDSPISKSVTPLKSTISTHSTSLAVASIESIAKIVKTRLADVGAFNSGVDVESIPYFSTVRCSIRRSNSHPASNAAMFLSLEPKNMKILYGRLVLGAHGNLFHPQASQFQFLNTMITALTLAGPLTTFLKDSTPSRLRSYAKHLFNLVGDSTAAHFKPSDEYVSIFQEEGKDEYRKILSRNVTFILLARLFTFVARSQQLSLPETVVNSIDVNSSLRESEAYLTFDGARDEKMAPIGKAVPKLTSYMQAAGEAQYTSDIQYASSGKFFNCGYALALTNNRKVVGFDLEAAKRVKGVKAIYTAEDLGSANSLTFFMNDVCLASTEVSFYGQPFAFVVAETPEIVKQAAALCKIKTEKSDKPIILTSREGAKEKSFYEDIDFRRIRGDAPGTIHKVSTKTHPNSDKFKVVRYVDINAGSQLHGYMEKASCIAEPFEGGSRLKVQMPTQFSAMNVNNIALALGMPVSHIEFVHRRAGGSFGGKIARHIMNGVLCAFAAKKLNLPVKLELDAETDVAITAGRHPFRTELSVVYNKETLELEAMDSMTIVNGGDTNDDTVGVAHELNGHIESCYRIPQISCVAKAVRTNIRSFCAVRSFGHIQSAVISEAMIEAVALDAGVHPDVVRIANIFRTPSQHALVAPPVPRLLGSNFPLNPPNRFGSSGRDVQGSKYVDIARETPEGGIWGHIIDEGQNIRDVPYNQIVDKFAVRSRREGEVIIADYLTKSTERSSEEESLLRKRITSPQKNVVPNLKAARHDAEISLSAVIEMSNYKKLAAEVAEFNKTHVFKKRGISLCPVRYGVFLVSNTAYVSISALDGSVVVISGGHEMGQGLDVKVCQTVAYGLGCPLDSVFYRDQTSAVALASMPTGGSVGSVSSCEAALNAALKFKPAVEAAKAALLEEKRDVTWPAIVQTMAAQGADLQQTGHFSGSTGFDPHSDSDFPPTVEDDKVHYFNYGCGVAIAEVDALNGSIIPIKFFLAYDCGHSINPSVDIGQMEGGLSHGFGYLTLEELPIDPATGMIKAANLWDYKMPTMTDMPRHIEVGLLPNKPNKRESSFKSKDVGEPPMICSRALTGAARVAVNQLYASFASGNATQPEKFDWERHGFNSTPTDSLWINGPMSVDRVVRAVNIQDDHLAEAIGCFANKSE